MPEILKPQYAKTVTWAVLGWELPTTGDSELIRRAGVSALASGSEDLCPSAGALVLRALSLDEDADDMGPSSVCDLQGLNPVKDPGFSSVVTPLC